MCGSCSRIMDGRFKGQPYPGREVPELAGEINGVRNTGQQPRRETGGGPAPHRASPGLVITAQPRIGPLVRRS
jgi:hypothetical protein